MFQIDTTVQTLSYQGQNTKDGHSILVFFFLIKRQNGKCNVRNFRLFLFVMSPDELAFKVRILTSDFKFRIGVNE